MHLLIAHYILIYKRSHLKRSTGDKWGLDSSQKAIGHPYVNLPTTDKIFKKRKSPTKQQYLYDLNIDFPPMIPFENVS